MEDWRDSIRIRVRALAALGALDGGCRMNIKHLSAFLTVADSRSFTQAARILGLAQPTVTARIKSLEQTLDTPLLLRTASGASLTPAGRRLHRYARRIVQLSELAQQSVCDPADAPDALVIGAAECIVTYRLVPLIEYLHLRHQQLDLSLRALDADPVRLVREEQIDCAFFIGPRTAAADVHHRVLRPEGLSLVAHPEHPLAGRPVLSTADLAPHTVACANRESGYQRGLERALVEAGALARGILVLGSVDAVKRSVGEGIGMALLPTVAVAEELRLGQLRRLDWRAPFTVYSQCVWRRGLDDDPVFRTVLGTARQVLAESDTAAGPALQAVC
ncbi:LysR family transcriptional regulator [Streptomyces sp. IBSBF 2806]|uniref:LysR family transcriptional regulator n=1 Tax=Streptomyces sp. IBSBF 2806 TaxID=2903529 RepID=UPI002FDBADCA